MEDVFLDTLFPDLRSRVSASTKFQQILRKYLLAQETDTLAINPKVTIERPIDNKLLLLEPGITQSIQFSLFLCLVCAMHPRVSAKHFLNFLHTFRIARNEPLFKHIHAILHVHAHWSEYLHTHLFTVSDELSPIFHLFRKDQTNKVGIKWFEKADDKTTATEMHLIAWSDLALICTASAATNVDKAMKSALSAHTLHINLKNTREVIQTQLVEFNATQASKITIIFKGDDFDSAAYLMVIEQLFSLFTSDTVKDRKLQILVHRKAFESPHIQKRLEDQLHSSSKNIWSSFTCFHFANRRVVLFQDPASTMFVKNKCFDDSQFSFSQLPVRNRVNSNTVAVLYSLHFIRPENKDNIITQYEQDLNRTDARAQYDLDNQEGIVLANNVGRWIYEDTLAKQMVSRYRLDRNDGVSISEFVQRVDTFSRDKWQANSILYIMAVGNNAMYYDDLFRYLLYEQHYNQPEYSRDIYMYVQAPLYHVTTSRNLPHNRLDVSNENRKRFQNWSHIMNPPTLFQVSRQTNFQKWTRDLRNKDVLGSRFWEYVPSKRKIFRTRNALDGDVETAVKPSLSEALGPRHEILATVPVVQGVLLPNPCHTVFQDGISWNKEIQPDDHKHVFSAVFNQGKTIASFDLGWMASLVEVEPGRMILWCNYETQYASLDTSFMADDLVMGIIPLKADQCTFMKISAEFEQEPFVVPASRGQEGGVVSTVKGALSGLAKRFRLLKISS